MNRIIEIDLKDMYDRIFSVIEYFNPPINEYDYLILGEMGILEPEEYEFLNEFYSKMEDKLKKLIDQFNLMDSGHDKEYDFKILFENMNPELEKFYNNMPYKMFLHSGYWYIVRDYKKLITGNKCQLCASTKSLQVHHNNYKNKGMEYKNLDDLCVICDKCHSKHHNKGGK